MAAEPKMAPFSELESFVAKFRYLCSAGFNASLSLNSDGDGHARVSFEVDLGFLEPPMTLPPPISPYRPRRSPAYFRRLKKRRDSRQKSNDLSNSFTVSNDSMSVTEKVTENEEVQTDILVEDCRKCINKDNTAEEIIEPTEDAESYVSTCESTELVAKATRRDEEENMNLCDAIHCDAEEVNKLYCTKDGSSHDNVAMYSDVTDALDVDERS